MEAQRPPFRIQGNAEQTADGHFSYWFRVLIYPGTDKELVEEFQCKDAWDTKDEALSVMKAEVERVFKHVLAKMGISEQEATMLNLGKESLPATKRPTVQSSGELH